MLAMVGMRSGVAIEKYSNKDSNISENIPSSFLMADNMNNDTSPTDSPINNPEPKKQL